MTIAVAKIAAKVGIRIIVYFMNVMFYGVRGVMVVSLE